MTKKQRAEVVELLRCAADYIARGGRDPGGALSTAASYVNHDDDYFKFAVGVEQAVCRDRGIAGWAWPPPAELRVETLLEAAQRVEDGELP